MNTTKPDLLKRVGMASDHAGFELKKYLLDKLREYGSKVKVGLL